MSNNPELEADSTVVVKEMVCGFLFSSDRSEVVLIRKQHPAWQQGRLNGIGGGVQEHDCSPMCLDGVAVAMSREFREEALVEIPFERWTEITTIQGLAEPSDEYDLWRVTFLFCVCESDDEDTNWFYAAQTGEDEPVGRYLVDELPPTVIYNLRWLIPLALDTGIHKPLGLAGIQDLGPGTSPDPSAYLFTCRKCGNIIAGSHHCSQGGMCEPAIREPKEPTDDQMIECRACSMGTGGHPVRHLPPECRCPEDDPAPSGPIGLLSMSSDDP